MYIARSLKFHKLLWYLLLLSSFLFACSPSFQKHPSGDSKRDDPLADFLSPSLINKKEAAPLARMGYSIQVGAFQHLDNAVRLEQTLEAKGIDAYYFKHESGLYKVRFGNHQHYMPARREAQRLQTLGLIDSFFIVFPEDYAASQIALSGSGDLRTELVKTAKRFLGVPYRWGGSTVKDGFDCSGLTMVAYRLNGLNLPRVSRNQFRAGKAVSEAKLSPGDLVFFATKGGQRVTHVGMYVGNGEFIHAPRTGKTVRIEKMNNSFFSKTFVGGRTYL